ncbi:mlr1400 [Mesorhizobium japonicum MAFF 303099]|uniref:Mlr1400 protein n=1 Tax=Mesorhizobium japonicum (strain LMG 29417 / CECT 9101 / MAFF 303099) TaxID=266835 RepID=Q98KN0_RHILO|nr:mlr1400 [Mesorhizobium japonicum MAFF 303099]
MAAPDQTVVAVRELRQQHHRAVEQRRLDRYLALPVLGDRLRIFPGERMWAGIKPDVDCIDRQDDIAWQVETHAYQVPILPIEAKSCLSSHVQRDRHRAMVRRFRPIPAGARKALDFLAGRKDRAPGLAIADDVGNGSGVLRRQPLGQQDIVELAEMPLFGSARVIERPAVHFRPTLDDVLAEAAGRQHVDAGLRLVDHLETVAVDIIAGDLHALAVIIHVATDRPSLVGGMIRRTACASAMRTGIVASRPSSPLRGEPIDLKCTR